MLRIPGVRSDGVFDCCIGRINVVVQSHTVVHASATHAYTVTTGTKARGSSTAAIAPLLLL